MLVFFLASCHKEKSDVSRFDEISQMTVEIEGETYNVDIGGYEIDLPGRSESTDAASPNQIAEDFLPFAVSPGAEVVLSFSTKVAPKLSVYLWDEMEIIDELEVENNRFMLPEEEGQVTIEVVASWENAEGSYTFVVDMKG